MRRVLLFLALPAMAAAFSSSVSLGYLTPQRSAIAASPASHARLALRAATAPRIGVGRGAFSTSMSSIQVLLNLVQTESCFAKAYSCLQFVCSCQLATSLSRVPNGYILLGGCGEGLNYTRAMLSNCWCFFSCHRCFTVAVLHARTLHSLELLGINKGS